MKKSWYSRLEVIGTVLQGLSAILMLFPGVSTAYHIGAAIGIVVGTITQVKGLQTGYKSDNLPSGITKVMDQIPDSITGVKGSLIK
ncbi:MAG: hypothetical protein ACYDBV_11205 [Nitrospiria bacterium]